MNKGLRLLFRAFVSFFSYNVYNVYMVSHLFKRPSIKKDGDRRRSRKAQTVEDLMKIEEESLSLNPKKVSSLKMLFFAAIPDSWRKKLSESPIKCLRRGKNYNMFEKGIQRYEEEIDIVKLIQELRWLKLAVIELMEDGNKPRRTTFKKLESLNETNEFSEHSFVNPKEIEMTQLSQG